jgi:hypothetical protein
VDRDSLPDDRGSRDPSSNRDLLTGGRLKLSQGLSRVAPTVQTDVRARCRNRPRDLCTRCKRHMKPQRSYFDPVYSQWRAEFVLFEARCFRALCDFVRVRFDDLLDDYYEEGHESLNDFPAWAFERYLCEAEWTGAREDVR